MGKSFTSSTWGAPIQLIDSWLAPPTLVQAPRAASRVVQLFTRAGWLNRPAANTAPVVSERLPRPAKITALPASRSCGVRIVRTRDTQPGARADARLVISGRIGDVCAELERLAQLENRQAQQG
jgi:hypothetical protein